MPTPPTIPRCPRCRRGTRLDASYEHGGMHYDAGYCNYCGRSWPAPPKLVARRDDAAEEQEA